MQDAPLSSGIDAKPTRRQLLAGAAGLTAGGVTYGLVGISPVSAEVSVSDFAVGDATYEANDGTLYSPVVRVDVEWAYEGADKAAQVMVALLVDGGLAVSEMDSSVAAPADSGMTPLEAPAVDSRSWTSDQWNPPDGGSVTHDMDLEVRLEVRDPDGHTIVGANARDVATVTVKDGGPGEAAVVGGIGSVVFQETEGGETHTPTG